MWDGDISDGKRMLKLTEIGSFQSLFLFPGRAFPARSNELWVK